MFSVGDLHQHHHQSSNSNNNMSLATSRRHQTLVFWDFDSIHPTGGTTAAHFYRKIKDHLKEKGVASGGVHGKVFVPTGTNHAIVLQLEDLQLSLFQGTKSHLQLEMTHALTAVGDHHNPTEVAIVVVSREKCYVRDIKQLADNGFEVFVIHDAPRGTAAADILETYATRSFHLKDVIGEPQPVAAGACAAIAPSSGGGGGSAVATTPSSLTVLVEGRRVAVDELVKNDAVQQTLRQPTASGLRWCHTPSAHNVHDCPHAHAIATTASHVHAAAVGGGGVLPPPPSYNQAVQHLGQSPLIGPVPPPPPAGTSPLMGYYPQSSVASTSPSSGSGMLPRGLPPMHGVPLPPPSVPPQQQQHYARGAGGANAVGPSMASSKHNSASAPNPSSVAGGGGVTASNTSSGGGGAWGDSYRSPSSIQDDMEALLSKLTVPDAATKPLASTSAAVGHSRINEMASMADPTAVDFFSSLNTLASRLPAPTIPVAVASMPSRGGGVASSEQVGGGASTPSGASQASPVNKPQQQQQQHSKSAYVPATTVAAATPNVWLRSGGDGPRAAPAKPSHVDVVASEDLPTLESLGSIANNNNSKAAAVAAQTIGGNKGPLRGGGGSVKASFASIVGGGGGGKTVPPPSTTSVGAPGKKGSSGASATIAAASAGGSSRPKELNIDGHMVPLDQLIHNKFVDTCLRDGGVTAGRFCSETRAHSIMDCPFAHRDKYPLLQGGEVEGKTLLVNKALENLRGNTSYKGNFCTSPKPHDALKCTYLHRK